MFRFFNIKKEKIEIAVCDIKTMDTVASKKHNPCWQCVSINHRKVN